MESQEEITIGNGEGDEEEEYQNEDSEEQQEEGGETDEDMVVDGGMEDWNGFISGAAAQNGEVVGEWMPGDPVTPQHVLWLNGYTRGELALPIRTSSSLHVHQYIIDRYVYTE